MSIKGIEQGRASFAFEEVKNFVSNKKDKGSEYKSYVKKIPMLIKTNGLGATLAFMYSKKGTYEDILKTIIAWITDKDTKKLMTIKKDGDVSIFINELLKVENSTYKAITYETLEILGWMRRFAEGMVEKN